MSLRRAKQILRANVQRGAALLDKRHPRWFEKIDLDAFDLSSSQYCICGQLDAVRYGERGGSGHGSWEGGLRRLFGRRVNVFKENSRDETHGFVVPNELNDTFYDHGLNGWHYAEGIWKSEIAKRRKAAKLRQRQLLAA